MADEASKQRAAEIRRAQAEIDSIAKQVGGPKRALITEVRKDQLIPVEDKLRIVQAVQHVPAEKIPEATELFRMAALAPAGKAAAIAQIAGVDIDSHMRPLEGGRPPAGTVALRVDAIEKAERERQYPSIPLPQSTALVPAASGGALVPPAIITMTRENKPRAADPLAPDETLESARPTAKDMTTAASRNRATREKMGVAGKKKKRDETLDERRREISVAQAHAKELQTAMQASQRGLPGFAEIWNNVGRAAELSISQFSSQPQPDAPFSPQLTAPMEATQSTTPAIPAPRSPPPAISTPLGQTMSSPPGVTRQLFVDEQTQPAFERVRDWQVAAPSGLATLPEPPAFAGASSSDTASDAGDDLDINDIEKVLEYVTLAQQAAAGASQERDALKNVLQRMAQQHKAEVDFMQRMAQQYKADVDHERQNSRGLAQQLNDANRTVNQAKAQLPSMVGALQQALADKDAQMRRVMEQSARKDADINFLKARADNADETLRKEKERRQQFELSQDKQGDLAARQQIEQLHAALDAERDNHIHEMQRVHEEREQERQLFRREHGELQQKLVDTQRADMDRAQEELRRVRQEERDRYSKQVEYNQKELARYRKLLEEKQAKERSGNQQSSDEDTDQDAEDFLNRPRTAEEEERTRRFAGMNMDGDPDDADPEHPLAQPEPKGRLHNKPVDPNRMGHKKAPAALEQIRQFRKGAEFLRVFSGVDGWKVDTSTQRAMRTGSGFGQISAAPSHSGSGWSVPGRSGTQGWNPFGSR